jgi:hypothetical protein
MLFMLLLFDTFIVNLGDDIRAISMLGAPSLADPLFRTPPSLANGLVRLDANK